MRSILRDTTSEVDGVSTLNVKIPDDAGDMKPENEISEKEKDIIGYENGVIPINIPLLKSSIGEFMQGWFAYTTMMFPNNHRIRNQEATENKDIWLTQKLEALATDK